LSDIQEAGAVWTDILAGVTAGLDRRRTIALGGFPAVEVLELGPPHGRPVLFLHGTPGSFVEALGLEAVAWEEGLRIVAPNRPGAGRSSPWPERTLTDEADALGALADALGWSSFGVLGISGGGPRVLAAARYLGQRLDFAWVLAGWAPAETPALRAQMAPLDRVFASLALSVPGLLLPPMALVGWTASRNHPRHLLRFMRSYLSDADRRALDDQRFVALLQADVRVAHAQGARSPTVDALLCFRSWPFDPADIDLPVTFVHGDADRFVPLAFSQALRAVVLRASLEILPGLGHYGLFLAMPELLRRAVQR
jgi:pimeloyl-ACP methyl ester carboxylesterase